MGFKERSLSVLQNLVQNSKYLTFIHVIKTTFLTMPMSILISLWWGENIHRSEADTNIYRSEADTNIYRSEADTNIYRSEADTNKPLMRSDMTWKGRCFDW